jgi:hypothetical protein
MNINKIICFFFLNRVNLNKMTNFKKYIGALVGISVGYIIFRVGKIYILRRKYKHIPGPPTKGIFGYFFGNVLETFEWVKKGKIFPDFLFEWYF